MIRTILVTAFEPFGESPVNPSERVLAQLLAPTGARLRKAVLPVDSLALPGLLDQLLAESPPDLVLSLGEARSSAFFRVERLARNRLCFPRPDNAGRSITEGVVVEQGPPELPSSLPLERVLGALERAGVEASYSDDAGGYLCNQLFYTLRHRLGDSAPVGFLHLPSLPEQGFGAGLELSRQVTAVQLVLSELARGF